MYACFLPCENESVSFQDQTSQLSKRVVFDKLLKILHVVVVKYLRGFLNGKFPPSFLIVLWQKPPS